MPSLLASFVSGFNAQSFLVCFIILSIIVMCWRNNRQQNTFPQGPRGWPILGYIPNMIFGSIWYGYMPHEIMGLLAKKYGSVFSLKFGNKNVIVLNSYDTIKEAFQHINMNDRPENVMIKDQNVGTGILFSCGNMWREIRKFTVTKLKSFGFGKRNFAEKITAEAQTLNTEIAKLNGKPFFPRSRLEAATINVISSITLGQRFEYDDKQLHFILDSMHTNGKLIGSGGTLLFVPFLQKFMKKTINEYHHNIHNILTYFRSIVTGHQEDFSFNDDPQDYIDAYLNEMQHKKEKKTQSHLDIPNLVMTIANLFAAGAFTTSETLSWAILYLTKNPDIQKRVHQEIDDVIGQNRHPKLEDKEKMPFTWAVVLETMRLATVAPLGVTHSVANDTQMFGCTIPKGTMITSNVWNVHHDPTLWHDPYKFKPERFLNEQGQVEEPRYLLPFGIGRRSCPGEQLGRMELFIFTAHLMQRFFFKEAEGMSLAIESISGFSYSPAPYNVCAHLREYMGR